MSTNAEDKAAREKVPERGDVPTKYHPCQDLLMVVPLPTITKVGSIILPQSSVINLNEGHIIEKGPRCSDQFTVGDCITWDVNSEFRMKVDDVAFILVRESVISMKIPHSELNQSDPNQPKLPIQQCPICKGRLPLGQCDCDSE